jgi:secreted trypsin-like serine protease
LATKTVDVISLALNPSVNRIPVSECEESVPLIVGGTKAARSEFPHMTAIGWSQWDGSIEWQCGGSIISEYWILSAGHCKVIGRASPDVVRVGTHRLSRPKSGYADFQITELLTPPEPQNYVASSRYNDIMLIRVDRQMHFHKNLRPACLWHEPRIDSSTALVSGWGKQEFSDTKGTDDLLKVSLNIYDNAVCRRQYPPERRTRDGIIDSQLCAGTLAGGKDSCQVC